MTFYGVAVLQILYARVSHDIRFGQNGYSYCHNENGALLGSHYTPQGTEREDRKGLQETTQNTTKERSVNKVHIGNNPNPNPNLVVPSGAE